MLQTARQKLTHGKRQTGFLVLGYAIKKIMIYIYFYAFQRITSDISLDKGRKIHKATQGHEEAVKKKKNYDVSLHMEAQDHFFIIHHFQEKQKILPLKRSFV